MIVPGFEYLARAPQGPRAEKLVVLLHGYGRNAFIMDKMADAVAATLPAALVLSVHGTEPALAVEADDGAEDGAASPDIRRQWFGMDGHSRTLIRRVAGAADGLNRFIDNQRDALGIADRDIALMGFSQGAALALYAGLSRPVAPGAVVCHSSIVIADPAQDGRLTGRPPLLFLYGDRDPVFSAAHYRDSARWLQAYGGDRVQTQVSAGLGHYTSALSRRDCAAFIREMLL